MGGGTLSLFVFGRNGGGGGKKVWGELKICMQNLYSFPSNKHKTSKKFSACGGRTMGGGDSTPCNFNYFFLLNISRRKILVWVGLLKNLQEKFSKNTAAKCLEN